MERPTSFPLKNILLAPETDSNLKKILIVEDERILAVSLKMDLEEVGYEEVILVTNCDDACQAVLEEAPGLVLMDISIEGEKNGIETAERISGLSQVPVIYLTGETDIETRSKAEKTPNCKGYLTKPVNMTLLEPLMHQVFSVQTF
jgi:DNA-binding response OmpR family regulator